MSLHEIFTDISDHRLEPPPLPSPSPRITLRPILIYFEFRGKPSLTVIFMDPHSPNKLIVTKCCFLILGNDTSFFFFLSFFFVLCYVMLFICCYKVVNKSYFIIILFYFFHRNYFNGVSSMGKNNGYSYPLCWVPSKD